MELILEFGVQIKFLYNVSLSCFSDSESMMYLQYWITLVYSLYISFVMICLKSPAFIAVIGWQNAVPALKTGVAMASGGAVEGPLIFFSILFRRASFRGRSPRRVLEGNGGGAWVPWCGAATATDAGLTGNNLLIN